jgi:hypothetical protein
MGSYIQSGKKKKKKKHCKPRKPRIQYQATLSLKGGEESKSLLDKQKLR